MMISPEAFYETEIKGKSKKEIRKVIHQLEKEIKKLQDEVENGTGEMHIDPSPETVLFWTKEYFELAKKVYQFGRETNRVTRVRYIGESDLSLTNGKEYDVISIEKGWYRIIDNSREDYLFPPEEFTIVRCQCEINNEVKEINEFDSILLWDGRRGAITDILAADYFYVDVGTSEEDWDSITVPSKEIRDVLYAIATEYICIDYWKETREKAEDSSAWTKSGEHAEQLIIDRKQGTITYRNQISEEEFATYSYCSKDRIDKLLLFFPSNYFSLLKDMVEERIEEPTQTRKYKILFRDMSGSEEVIEGSYDLGGLPEYWYLFMNEMQSIMASFVEGDLFDRRSYEKPRRRPFDLIICQVSFSEYSDEFSYLTDDDSLKEGDKVLVPLGPRDRENIGRIVFKGYYSEDNAPYPVDKIKKIIKKIEEE